MKMPRSRCTEQGKTAQFPELEEDVAAWITSKRREGVGVSTTVICLNAKALAHEKGITTDKFKVSQSWCYKFLAHNGFSIHRRTTVAQKRPEDFEDKLINFQCFILGMLQCYDFDLSMTGNADQTPLTFDIASNTTVLSSGIKTVPIMATGHEKDRLTVMLACRGDGSKLPPYVVFKKKTLPKNIKFPDGMLMRCHEKGWMDEALVKDWLNSVWAKVGGLMKCKSLLVWDSFRGHPTQPVKNTLARLNTVPAIIPGGMTSMLKSFDDCE